MEENKIIKYTCYCCKKLIAQTEDYSLISATMSGKYKDGTYSEKRVVCKNCNHL